MLIFDDEAHSKIGLFSLEWIMDVNWKRVPCIVFVDYSLGELTTVLKCNKAKCCGNKGGCRGSEFGKFGPDPTVFLFLQCFIS